MDELLTEIGKRISAECAEAYFVGGCVRDMLRGAPVRDVDFAVREGAHALGRRLAHRYHGHVFWLRQEEDVTRVLLPDQEGLQIDLCPLHGSLEQDLMARDLTINAMAVPAAAGLSPSAQLVDPSGGRADLAARLIRFVAPSAPERDPLRTLRALRFRWQLRFDLDGATASRIAECVPLLSRVSSERIRDELFHLLALSEAAPALEECLALGMARWLAGADVDIPEEAGRPAPAARVQAVLDLLPSTPPELEGLLAGELTPPRRRRELLLWAAAIEPLCPPLDPAAAARALALSNDERQLIARAVAGSESAAGVLRRWPAPGRLRYRMLRGAHPAGPEAVVLAGARDGWTDGHAELLAEALQRHFWPPAPLLSGVEVMQLLDLEPGPQVGRALEEVEEARADGLLRTGPDAARWLRDRYGR